MGPLEHSVPDLALLRTVNPFPRSTEPDPLEHSGLLGKEDGGRDLVSLEPLEHSVLGTPLDQRDVSSSDVGLRVDSLSAGCPSVVSDDRGVEVAPLDDRLEATRTPPEAGDAIVVGALYDRHWFPSDDFGYDDIRTDVSPLTVKGELELNVFFPGLCCDMLFVVANIGSDGLLGTEALQSCLPHQLDLRTGQLRAAGRSTLQLHQQRLIPEVDGFLMTSVVLTLDSEIVAPFSVSGVRPNCCALVEPSRTLTEEYGVIASSRTVF